MILAGLGLAQRLERAEAANDADCTSAKPHTAVEPFAGGWAIFNGADSPLTRAIGLGLDGAVPEAEIDALERFFHHRGARISIDFCPLASPELLASLSRRGYRADEFNNVMVKLLVGAPPYPPDDRVERTGDEQLWSRVVGEGFFERPRLSDDEMEVGLAVFRSRPSECYLAYANPGEPAGGAALSIRDNTAVLFADGSIPRYRRRGFQSALIRHRVNDAIARGCDLAAATTAPGSGSQRNYERLGFQVAYTRVLLVEAE
jgi:GNAT superfamily N-acetyltransferase